MMTRRNFMGAGFGLAASGLILPTSVIAAPKDRTISIVNMHTGERISTTYWSNGKYLKNELADISKVLRDHRTGEIIAFDSRLFDFLGLIHEKVGSKNEFQIWSAYRSPKTNASLRSMGAAENSYHIRGKALDLNLPGTHLTNMKKAARSLRAGGVGFYPESKFIHLDTGPARSWHG